MSARGLQLDPALGVERSQVVEQDLVSRDLRVFVVDLLHLQKGEITLGVLRGPDLPGDRVAGSQIEPPDLGGGDVDVIRAREIVGIRGPEEPETVRKDLQDAFPIDEPLSFRVGLQE